MILRSRVRVLRFLFKALILEFIIDSTEQITSVRTYHPVTSPIKIITIYGYLLCLKTNVCQFKRIEILW